MAFGILIAITITGIHGYAEFQTKDLCIRANKIIEKNGSLTEIEIDAEKHYFTKSGNGKTQALFTKFFTLPGLCIITLNNGKPIKANYAPHT